MNGCEKKNVTFLPSLFCFFCLLPSLPSPFPPYPFLLLFPTKTKCSFHGFISLLSFHLICIFLLLFVVSFLFGSLGFCCVFRFVYFGFNFIFYFFLQFIILLYPPLYILTFPNLKLQFLIFQTLPFISPLPKRINKKV